MAWKRAKLPENYNYAEMLIFRDILRDDASLIMHFFKETKYI